MNLSRHLKTAAVSAVAATMLLIGAPAHAQDTGWITAKDTGWSTNKDTGW